MKTSKYANLLNKEKLLW